MKDEIDIDEFCKWCGFDDYIISLLKEKHADDVEHHEHQIDFINHCFKLLVDVLDDE